MINGSSLTDIARFPLAESTDHRISRCMSALDVRDKFSKEFNMHIKLCEQHYTVLALGVERVGAQGHVPPPPPIVLHGGTSMFVPPH